MTDYEKEQEEEKLASDIGISELLKPMENAPCLIKVGIQKMEPQQEC